MSNEKLIISSKKYRGDSTVISIRLPDELVKKLDEIAEETGRTRNEVIQKCLAFAVDNLEIKEQIALLNSTKKDQEKKFYSANKSFLEGNFEKTKKSIQSRAR